MENEVITNRRRIPTPFKIGVLVFIVIALIVFFFVFLKDKVGNPIENLTNKTTSGWQIQNSPNNSYSFSYPENAAVKTRANGALGVEFIEPETNGGEGDFPPGYVVEIEEKDFDGKTLKEIADEAYNTPLTAPDEKSIEEIELNGYKGFKVVRKIQTASTYIFLDANNGKYLSIYYNVYDKNAKGYEETVNQIVNSFILTQ